MTTQKDELARSGIVAAVEPELLATQIADCFHAIKLTCSLLDAEDARMRRQPRNGRRFHIRHGTSWHVIKHHRLLDGIGDSQPLRNLIANGMLHGDEVSLPEKSSVDAREFISEQFRKLLGREPNTYELAVFANEWAADPAVGPRTVIRAIIGSREYQSQ